MTTPVAVLILAAGKGTRMKSALPKVMHKVAGLPMLFHVTNAGKSVSPEKTVAIIGHGSEVVEQACQNYDKSIELALQTEQLGTGHAVMQAEDALQGFEGDVIILTGDCPLMEGEMVQNLLTAHQMGDYAITFVSTFVDDPTGLGRVKRNTAAEVEGILEHKDASEEELKINEINTGIYAVKSKVLFKLLKKVNNDNSQGEYYLPDIIPLAIQEGLTIGTSTTEDSDALAGVNSRKQLSFAEKVYQTRKRDAAMDFGITMQAPESVYFSWDTKIEEDVFIGPNVRFMENVTVEKNCVIEGSCYLKNCKIEEGATLMPFCYIEDATIASGRKTEPFTCIAPDANIISKISSIS